MSNLKNVKLEELRKMASQMKIEGRSKMNKEELLKVVKKNIKKGGVLPTELSIITKGIRHQSYENENHHHSEYDPNEEIEIKKKLGRIIGFQKIGNIFKLFTEKKSKIYLVQFIKGTNIDITTNVINNTNHLYITENINIPYNYLGRGYLNTQIIKEPSILRSIGSRIGIRPPIKHNLTTNEYIYKNYSLQNQRGQIVRTIPENFIEELLAPPPPPPRNTTPPRNTIPSFIKAAYATLEVEPNSNFETVVKRSYKKLILKAHPNKGGKKEDFIKIQNAFHKIKNYEKLKQNPVQFFENFREELKRRTSEKNFREEL